MDTPENALSRLIYLCFFCLSPHIPSHAFLLIFVQKYALASEENKAEDDGASALCDVAPTVLDLLAGG
jgi:hypothetical protein